jgi:hypothetical protein
VLAAAIAAGFLLWLGAWFTQGAAHTDPGVTMASIPAQSVMGAQAPSADEIMLALRERDRR